MNQIRVVRYTTSEEARDENVRLISDVYASLAEAQPEGLRYATLLLAGAPAFVHLAVQDGDRSPLPQLPAFQEFQRELGSRVLAPPDAKAATLIGNFRLL